eukprot:TRINITY_DN2298_c0_g1_i1.p1 TRINITY_DN2298_c0_g1~~TRINITY_DN2298_c0_g1_i1.p1  ORF type:complete len:503 (-),score=141.27 TRINITY_DN2298_c0_g1_i1:68-1576(-)
MTSLLNFFFGSEDTHEGNILEDPVLLKDDTETCVSSHIFVPDDLSFEEYVSDQSEEGDRIYPQVDDLCESVSDVEEEPSNYLYKDADNLNLMASRRIVQSQRTPKKEGGSSAAMTPEKSGSYVLGIEKDCYLNHDQGSPLPGNGSSSTTVTPEKPVTGVYLGNGLYDLTGSVTPPHFPAGFPPQSLDSSLYYSMNQSMGYMYPPPYFFPPGMPPGSYQNGYPAINTSQQVAINNGNGMNGVPVTNVPLQQGANTIGINGAPMTNVPDNTMTNGNSGGIPSPVVTEGIPPPPLPPPPPGKIPSNIPPAPPLPGTLPVSGNIPVPPPPPPAGAKIVIEKKEEIPVFDTAVEVAKCLTYDRVLKPDEKERLVQKWETAYSDEQELYEKILKNYGFLFDNKRLYKAPQKVRAVVTIWEENCFEKIEDPKEIPKLLRQKSALISQKASEPEEEQIAAAERTFKKWKEDYFWSKKAESHKANRSALGAELVSAISSFYIEEESSSYSE